MNIMRGLYRTLRMIPTFYITNNCWRKLRQVIDGSNRRPVGSVMLEYWIVPFYVVWAYAVSAKSMNRILL